MIELTKILLSQLIPWALGISILLNLFRNQAINKGLLLALAYGLGLGLLCQWMLILNILKVPFSILTIASPMLVLTIYLLTIYTRGKTPLRRDTLIKDNDPGVAWQVMLPVLYIFIAYFVFYVFWRSLNIPIQTWDAVSTIAYKAKIIFHEQRIPPLATLPHSPYPLQVPLSEAWVALSLNRWDEHFVKIIFPLTFAAYLIIHYSVLRLFVSQRWATLGIALLLSSNFFVYHGTIGYRDLTMLYFNCTTILLLIMWHTKRLNVLLLLAGLFSGFTTFTKIEGSGYLMIHALILFTMIKASSPKESTSKPSITTFLIPSVIICGGYHLYKILTQSGAPTESFNPDLLPSLGERIFTIIQTFSSNMFLNGNWNILWFILLISLVNITKAKRQPVIAWLLIGIILYLGLYLVVGISTPYYISIAGADERTVLSRIILHFFPLCPMLIILLMAPIANRDFSNE